MSSNVLVDINDALIPDHAEIKKRISDVQVFAENLDVTSESALKEITFTYSQAKNWEKMIEQKRKELNAPEQSIINSRNDRVKEITEPLRFIQSICKRKADEYQRFLDQEKQKEEEKLKTAAAIFDTDVPYVLPASTNHRGDGAIAYSRTETRFRLVDLSQVPIKYLMLDESRIKQEIKAGVMEIPGLEIFQEKITQLKTRI